MIRIKDSHSLSPNMRRFLDDRDGDSVKIWVFFTDKGINTQAEFDSAASKISLTSKQVARRSKVNRPQIQFVDLPVKNDYVSEIVRAGAKLRRVSRWLNAASFEVPDSQLDRINSLPFVASLRPVAAYRRPLEPVENDSIETSPDATTTTYDLNYGQSYAQLNLIYVPILHDMGLDGSGVTLAIFDSGYRKTHEAFAQHYLDGRVLAEYDFIFNDEETSNEPEDVSSQWNHGTNCWSLAGGFKDGRMYGPAYRANFLLAKTEDLHGEYIGEEDNWVAALEWADLHGADVITSSVGYLDWYTWEDMDGATAITTIAANTAAGLGILLVNAIGNEGPAEGTLIAPADAHDMLAVGSVDALGNIAVSSSRGPTWDGRIKPEVCARGVSNYFAHPYSDTYYGYGSGTSYATPLVAGTACLLIQAYPLLSPQMIRQMLMETACQADAPDNVYGWGVIDADLAANWGAQISADVREADAPLTVHFEGNSGLTVSSWLWTFGDGQSSEQRNPRHVYEQPGVYDVTLTTQTDYGEMVNHRPAYIFAFADTMTFESDSALAGNQATISIFLANTQPAERITIPFAVSGDLAVQMDSVTFGDRTAHFEYLQYLVYDPFNGKFTFRLIADNGGGSEPLSVGSGEVARIFLTVDQYALGDVSSAIDSTNQTYTVEITSPYTLYGPHVFPGEIRSSTVRRGDADYSGRVDIEDAVYIVDYVFNEGETPATVQSADVNADLSVNLDDIVYLIDAMFRGGPPPPTP